MLVLAHTLKRATRGMVTPAGSHFTELTVNRTKLVNGGPKGVKLLAPGRSAMASVFASSTTRSLPSSPALNGVSSPNPGFSASQQVLEKNKGQRSALVHELAVRDQPYQRLKDVWTGADSDLQQTVEKVADFDKSTEKWSLKKRYWKELDVWNYDYSGPDDRQAAIDNAIKVYDKQRVVLSDAVWERLLPKEDRNKNIVLSKLQATIAKQGTSIPAPKLSTQKAEEGNKSDMDSSKAKGEAMSRSNSQPTANKPKKISEREAQTKRLLSNNPKKPAPKKPATKAKASEEKGKKILSEEFVYDSDTSDEAIPPSSQNTTTASKPKPPQKRAERPAEKPMGRVSEKPKEPPPPVALKPKPKPVVRPPRAPIKALGATNKSPQKRPREDEDGSSSSGAPLSKRAKPKEMPKPVAEPKAIKHRTSDASQNSRGTNGTVSSSFTMKSKNTSPTKSSPLAASPPTNASDLDERSSSQRPRIPSHQPPQQQHGNVARDRDRERGRDQGPAPSATKNISSTAVTTKKRKEREPVDESPETTPTPPTKKSRLSDDIIDQAHAFTEYYKSYKTLHFEMASMKDPPEDKLTKLLNMHERLKTMKRHIQRAVAAAAAKSGS